MREIKSYAITSFSYISLTTVSFYANVFSIFYCQDWRVYLTFFYGINL